MAEQAQWRASILRVSAGLAYTSGISLTVEHTSGNLPAMTRTPITTVTANAFAARAFAWGSSIGAHFSGIEPGTPPPLH
jgi:hypothetical protein